MKILLWTGFAVIILLIIIIYVFIPSKMSITVSLPIKATKDGTFRILSSAANWDKWWNHEQNSSAAYISGGKKFHNDGYTYELVSAGYNNALVNISNSGNLYNSKMTIVQFAVDSIAVLWQCTLSATINPFQRIIQYKKVINLKKNMSEVLSHLKSFAEKTINIYGINIIEGITKDTFLITKKDTLNHKPTMAEVYKSIESLRLYAGKYNCQQVDSPMFNLLKENGKYRVMVALPVNKEIEAGAPFSFIKMVTGRFVIAKVKGGLSTVDNSMNEVQLYFSDYSKTAMALPFQYLITNRIKESDTSQWVTEIYAPAF